MSKMSELHGFLFQECGTTYNTLYFLATGILSLNDVHLQVYILRKYCYIHHYESECFMIN